MKKQPKQQRSKQIVDAVLAGATRILSKARLREVTTNKIAEVAGVGIGSLYDYFPNKTSIVTSLIDRRIENLVRDFKILLQKDPTNTLEEKIEEIVSFLETDFLDRKDFLKEIFLLAPESGRMEVLYRARVEISEVISLYLQEKSLHLSSVQANQKSFLVVHGILGIIESYIMIAPDYFTPTEISNEIRKAIRSALI